MKALGWFLLPFAVGAVVLGAGGSAPTRTHYEYRVETFTTDTAKLNALGRDGWELVLYREANPRDNRELDLILDANLSPEDAASRQTLGVMMYKRPRV